VLFNYQSSEGNPAVLTILVTREGTSVTIIDNKRDAFEAGGTWGQRFFFNKNGERCSLTGKRKSDYLAEAEQEQGATEASADVQEREGLNMVLLVQVPLKHKERERMVDMCAESAPMPPMATGAVRSRRSSDVEEAVIGHGKVEGPFTEIDGLPIERDERYPVRVTVQFYKATSNGVVSPQDMADIAQQINRVYQEADYVGSRVVEGETGRPTEHTGLKFEPPDWWDVFWQRHYANTGQTPEQAVEMLQQLLGDSWHDRAVGEVEEALKKAKQASD
jgi:hypothetical protein